MAISTAAFDDASDGGSKATYTPSINPNIGVGYGTDYSGTVVNQLSAAKYIRCKDMGKGRPGR